jgi:hypothetical protein
MPFGKYKNQPIDQVPSGYLDWLITTELRDPVRAAVVAELARRKATTPSMPSSTSSTTPTRSSTTPITPSENTNGTPTAPARRRQARQPVPEQPVPTVCNICGLPGRAQKPLVHESCLHDEVPF